MTESQRIIIDAISRWGEKVEEIDRFGTKEQRRVFSDWWSGVLPAFGDNLVFNGALLAIRLLESEVVAPDLRDQLQRAIVEYFKDVDVIDYVRVKFGIGCGLSFSVDGVEVGPVGREG